MVTAGVIALALGYPMAGWILIGIPVALGIVATAWYTLKAYREDDKPPE